MNIFGFIGFEAGGFVVGFVLLVVLTFCGKIGLVFVLELLLVLLFVGLVLLVVLVILLIGVIFDVLLIDYKLDPPYC